MIASHSELVLASTSPYRRELLLRLGLPFVVTAPGVAEQQLTDEPPIDMAVRLAAAKAKACAPLHPNALIIGSDQVLELHGQALGKPGHHTAAVAQLTALSGQAAHFHTAVALYNARTGHIDSESVTTVVRFRVLTGAAIERYLAREPAYDCAGSAKSEGLGITLMLGLEGTDPTALIGLPLIALTTLLLRAGVTLP